MISISGSTSFSDDRLKGGTLKITFFVSCAIFVIGAIGEFSTLAVSRAVISLRVPSFCGARAPVPHRPACASPALLARLRSDLDGRKSVFYFLHATHDAS